MGVEWSEMKWNAGSGSGVEWNEAKRNGVAGKGIAESGVE
jgi:hypothetical protein